MIDLRATFLREFETCASCNTILGSGLGILPAYLCSQHTSIISLTLFPPLSQSPASTVTTFVTLLSLIDPHCFAFHVCTGENWRNELRQRKEMMMYVGHHSENPSEKGREREHGHWACTKREGEHLHSQFLDSLMQYKYFCWALINVDKNGSLHYVPPCFMSLSNFKQSRWQFCSNYKTLKKGIQKPAIKCLFVDQMSIIQVHYSKYNKTDH